MAIAIPDEVRAMLEAPNYVHLATLRADGSPRSWVVWAGLEGDLAPTRTAAIWIRSRSSTRTRPSRDGGPGGCAV